MNAKLWTRLLKGMKNEELATLGALTEKEQNRRADKRIREGKFAKLNEVELHLLGDGNPQEAVKEYVKRTNCPMVMARKIVNLALQLEAPIVIDAELPPCVTPVA